MITRPKNIGELSSFFVSNICSKNWFGEIVRRNIWRRILKRDFYHNLAEIDVRDAPQLKTKTESDILFEIRSFVGQNPVPYLTAEEKLQDPLRKEEVTIVRKKIDDGFGQENPVKKVRNFQIQGLVIITSELCEF